MICLTRTLPCSLCSRPAAPAPPPPPALPAVAPPAPAPAAPQPAHKRGEFDVNTMISRRDVEDLFELVARAALDDGDLESGASFISTVKNFVGNHGDTIFGTKSSKKYF